MRGYCGVVLVAVLVAGLGLAPVCLAQARPATTGTGTNNQKAGLKTDALIQYDLETGTLLVVTDEETNQEISKVIETLDRPVPQVLIKVLFLEVTHTNGLDLGVEGMKKHTTTHIRPLSTQVDTRMLETIFGVADQTTGGFYRILEQDLEVTLHALAEVTKLEVLSRPSILTRNNQQAVITVGKRVPFIQNSRITQDGQTINTVTYDDIGIILQVTPHITDDRVVSMDVTPEISTLTGETVPISTTVNAPVFATRSAQTGVVVPDGKTVVIGGLMEDSKTKNTKKVPLLGDIPLFGALFQKRSDDKSKTELLIFLTPHVILDATELESTSATERANTDLAPKAFPEPQMEHFLGTTPEGDGKESAKVSEAQPAVGGAAASEEVPATKGNKGSVMKNKR